MSQGNVIKSPGKLPSMPDEDSHAETIWHYAVFKGQRWYYEPACVGRRMDLDYSSNTHGLTVNRGDVTCSDCKRMMGMP